MNHKGDVAPKAAGPWTRPEAYLDSLIRRRTSRRPRSVEPRTEPEAPRFALSTLPFLVLLGALLVIAAGIIVAAWPASQPQPQPTAAAKEIGTAPRGWFQEAEKEFRNRG